MNYEGIQQVLDTTYVNYVPTARLCHGQLQRPRAW